MRRAPQVSLALGGAAIGAIAWAVEVWGGVRVPHGYGLCTTCHGQDLLGWLASRLLDLNWTPSAAGIKTPILSVVGILLGASLASWLGGERRIVPARHPWLSLGAGLLCANLGLLALGCPIRQLILAGYGDWLSVPALVGHTIGVWSAVTWMRWQAARAL